MTYNGVGLKTVRGSGTNGYVQRNFSYIRSKTIVPNANFDDKSIQPTPIRTPNKEIMEHQRKRQLELQVLMYQEMLQGKGYPEEEITDRVNKKRKALLEALEKGQDMGEKSLKDSHQISTAQTQKNERLRNALGISDNYEEGARFKEMEIEPTAEEKKKKEADDLVPKKKFLERLTEEEGIRERERSLKETERRRDDRRERGRDDRDDRRTGDRDDRRKDDRDRGRGADRDDRRRDDRDDRRRDDRRRDDRDRRERGDDRRRDDRDDRRRDVRDDRDDRRRDDRVSRDHADKAEVKPFRESDAAADKSSDKRQHRSRSRSRSKRSRSSSSSSSSSRAS